VQEITLCSSTMRLSSSFVGGNHILMNTSHNLVQVDPNYQLNLILDREDVCIVGCDNSQAIFVKDFQPNFWVLGFGRQANTVTYMTHRDSQFFLVFAMFIVFMALNCSLLCSLYLTAFLGIV
jgi:hypothetical protein